MDHDVVIVRAKELNHLPYLVDPLVRIGPKPEDSSARGELLWWLWKVDVEPVESTTQMFPFFGIEVAGI